MPGGGSDFERRQCRKTELPAVAIGDGRVADEAFARAEVAAGALQEQAWRVELCFDRFAERADVVGADQRVLPGERRRMAGIVDERADRPAIVGS